MKYIVLEPISQANRQRKEAMTLHLLTKTDIYIQFANNYWDTFIQGDRYSVEMSEFYIYKTYEGHSKLDKRSKFYKNIVRTIKEIRNNRTISRKSNETIINRPVL